MRYVCQNCDRDWASYQLLRPRHASWTERNPVYRDGQCCPHCGCEELVEVNEEDLS